MQFKKNIYKLKYLLLSTSLVFFCACEDFVTVDAPKTQVVSVTVFSDNATAMSALAGIYSKITEGPGFASGSFRSITHLGALSADEFDNYTASLNVFSDNSLTPESGAIKSDLWDRAYEIIYYANSLLGGLEISQNLSENTKKQLEGEAKFLRAFCYFYLVNFFGEIPLATTVDYRVNNSATRNSIDEVYSLIVSDLIDAQNLLKEDYSSSQDERVRPNKSAATAILSRVYLYIGEWDKAEIQASQVIDNTSLYGLEPNLDNTFLKNSNEAIWQLLPSRSFSNTNEGSYLIIISDTPSQAIKTTLLEAFEDNDLRRASWVNSYTSSNGTTYFFPYKYKKGIDFVDETTEYYMVLRLAEQYLIRAEARAQQNKLMESIQDIDVIRARAGLPLIGVTSPDINQANLLLAIEGERQIELFSEWGHRWLDLKRTERANTILSPIKNEWQQTDVLYPIPQADRKANPNLSQNEGY